MAKAAKPRSTPEQPIPTEIVEAIQRIDQHLAAMHADLQQMRVIASDLSTAISDATHRYNRIAAAIPDNPATYER